MSRNIFNAYDIIEYGIEYNVIECFSGDKHWYYMGFRHRETGPAVEYYDGTKEYWLYNIKY